MFRVLPFTATVHPYAITAPRLVVKMSATVTKNAGRTVESLVVKPPAHPTYDLKGVIQLALSEDAGDLGDVSCKATIPVDLESEAYFLAKEDGIVAGIALAEMIFAEVDPSLKVEWFIKDGDKVHKGLKFGKVQGKAHSIVVAERVVLNFMQRMSGIATLTKAMADAAHPAYILETRKTAPGLRLVDKWAVLIGGGKNHRMGLFDMVMIKDNHISAAGSVSNALKSVDQYLEQNKLHMGVEVETRTLAEVHEVLEYASQTKTSLTRIMLDNMVIPLSNGDVEVSMLKEAVDLIDGRFETEASGNVTLETVHTIGQTGVTYISSQLGFKHVLLDMDSQLAIQWIQQLAAGATSPPTAAPPMQPAAAPSQQQATDQQLRAAAPSQHPAAAASRRQQAAAPSQQAATDHQQQRTVTPAQQQTAYQYRQQATISREFHQLPTTLSPQIQ